MLFPYTSKETELLITQYEGNTIEDAGVIKMDFLGLKTLTIIRDTTETPDIPDTSPPEECTIDGLVRAPNEINPDNICEQCIPSLSATAWSSRGPRVDLLVAGTDPTSQGWLVISQSPSSLVVTDDHIEISTSTQSGQPIGGQFTQ